MCIQILKTASANVHGAYCKAIEARLKLLLGKENVLLNWEDGKMSQYVSSPTSTVQIGFYLVFAGVSTIFIAFAILSYKWQNWTAYVHIIEFVVLLVYAFFAIRWNTPSRRADIVNYAGIDSELSSSNGNPSKAQR